MKMHRYDDLLAEIRNEPLRLPANFRENNALRDRRAALEDMKSIVDAATKEKRDITRREKEQLDLLEQEINRLDEQLRLYREQEESFGGFPALNGFRTSGDQNILLRSDQSFAEAVCGRTGTRTFDPLTDGDDGFNVASLGRIIRAAVTGDRADLNESELRALGTGSDATGGVNVGTQLSSMVIDRARASAAAVKAGALTVPMPEGRLVMAKLVGGNAAIWHGENQPDIVGDDQVWDRIEFVPRTIIAGPQLLSRELYEDASPQAHEIILRELTTSVALALDLAVFEGTGQNGEPLGIAGTTGVNEITLGANGGKPTSWAEVVRGWYEVKKANGADPTAAVFHPRDLENYALLSDTLGQPLRKPETIVDLPLLSTTQIATNRDQGTSTGVCSNAYVGDFSQVIIACRPQFQIRLITLQERYATPAFQIGLMTFLRADVAVVRPEHLTRILGYKP